MLTGLLALILLIFVASLMGVFVLLRKADALYQALRPLMAFRRLHQGLALAMEEGRRLQYTIGRGPLTGASSTGSSLVALAALDPIVRTALRGDKPPAVTAGEPTVYVLADNTTRVACRENRAEERCQPQPVRLVGMEESTYAAGAVVMAHGGQSALTLGLGHMGGEIVLAVDASERFVGGTDHLTGQAVLFATSDETLIGEEALAAGAYMRAHPMHAASLWVQDLLRWLLVFLLLAGGLVYSLIR
ncbi:MAG: hypothetical protein GXO36_05280 [Chloroflexi bacterium]|nr:hypothetical protein [Chloroflexota bacterium]